MACGDGCCGPSPVTEPHDQGYSRGDMKPRPATPSIEDDDGCGASGCCGPKETDFQMENVVAEPAASCAPVAATMTASRDCGGCCSPATQSPSGTGGMDRGDPCCSIDTQPSADKVDACCASKTVKSDNAPCCSKDAFPREETRDGCCDDERLPEVEMDHCCPTQSKTGANACSSGFMDAPKDSCCSTTKPNDDCCAPTKAEAPSNPQVSKAPDCCEGKTSPCCDEECIERIALRECQSASQGLLRKHVYLWEC